MPTWAVQTETADMVCKIVSRQLGMNRSPGLSEKRVAFCTRHEVEVFPEHWSQRQLFLCEQERITRNLKRTLPAFYKRNFLSNKLMGAGAFLCVPPIPAFRLTDNEFRIGMGLRFGWRILNSLSNGGIPTNPGPYQLPSRRVPPTDRPADILASTLLDHGKLIDLTIASPHAQGFQYRQPEDAAEHLMRTKKNTLAQRPPLPANWLYIVLAFRATGGMTFETRKFLGKVAKKCLQRQAATQRNSLISFRAT